MNNSKILNRFILALGICFFISGIFARERVGAPVSLEKLDGGAFDANRIYTDISNTGFIVDYHPTGHSGMEWPKGSGNYSNFQSGVWFAGKVNDAIRTATAEYSTEFLPGSYGGDSSADEFQLYTVNKSDLADPLASDDFQNWPAHRGAPWVDNDGDGVYSPLPAGPDHPEFIGDQVTFYTMNDGEASSHVLYGTAPLGIEVRVTMWGYDRPDAFGDMMFVKTQAFNMGGEDITDMMVGVWDDPDLGDAGDDFVGCDTELSLGFCYNDGSDASYGDAAPAMGYDFFQATVPGSDGDEAFGFGQMLSGYQNLPMSSFVKYINGDAVYSDPETAQEVYNYMTGFKADGTPFVNSETGEDSKFVHPCDPNDDSGPGDGCWVDGDDHDSADRRFLMNVGPFNFPAGDSLEVVFGIIHAQANDALSSVTLLKEVDQLAQLAYDNQFSLPELPLQPNVNATASFEEIILTWDSVAELYTAVDEIDLDENGNPTSFVFEGYNVWQHSSLDGTGDKKLLATFDVVNGITAIMDDVFDPSYGSSINVAVQNGSDSGLQHWLKVSRDDLNGGSPLINDREYFFTVNAYGYNSYGIPKTLESSDNIFEIRPQNNIATSPTVEAGFSDFTIEHTGNSDGSISVKVIDPYMVTGHDYEVFLDSFYVDWESGVNLGLAIGPDCAGEYVMSGETQGHVLDCDGTCWPTDSALVILGDGSCDANLNCATHNYDNDDCVELMVGSSCYTCSNPPCIQDCSFNCVDEVATSYGVEGTSNGDGNCDNGSAGLDLDCEEFFNDHNDCVCYGYTISMVDAYGDGWNGNVLTIGTETFTLETGAAGVGCYNGPIDVVVSCGGGDWASEVSWTITDIDGNEVLAGGAPFEGCLGDCGGMVIADNGYSQTGTIEVRYKENTISKQSKKHFHNDNLIKSTSSSTFDPNGFMALGWNLRDVTTGDILLSNQTIQGGFDGLTSSDAGLTAHVVDGLEIVVNGPSNGIHGIYMVHNGSESTEANSDAPGASVLQSDVWANYDGVLAWAVNASGGYYFATQGGGTAADEASYYERVFRGTNFDRAIPNDFEMRFTEEGSTAWLAYTTGAYITVPFELWNVGDLSDPSDDYRMLPFVYDADGSGTYNWWGDLEDSGAENDPGTDWVYWWNPVDKSPGTSGYDGWLAGTVAYEAEVMARTVWNNWNGYGSQQDSIALAELTDPDPANWTAADTTMFTDRGWFFDSVNSLAGVTVAGDYAYGIIILMPETGSVYRWITNKPNTVSDSFTFSSSDAAPIATTDYECSSANVWPNPYYADNPEQNSDSQPEIHFTDLAEDSKISIYNLNGLLVDQVTDIDGQNAIWDAQNHSGLPVASGMYIAVITSDLNNCKEVRKIAVVTNLQKLDRY